MRFLQSVVLTSHNTWHRARQANTISSFSDLTNTQGCLSVLGLCFPVTVIEIFGHIHRLGPKIPQAFGG